MFNLFSIAQQKFIIKEKECELLPVKADKRKLFCKNDEAAEKQARHKKILKTKKDKLNGY
jgi:hypothetical protein